MQLEDAQSLADELLAQHGLADWRFTLDNARARCGACHYRDRKITVSQHFVRLNDAHEVTNAVLHEIAHALAGPRAGHGPAWREIAVAIGARPEATAAAVSMPRPVWMLVCTGCERVVARRHRRALDLDRLRCAGCGIERGRLVWQAAPIAL